MFISISQARQLAQDVLVQTGFKKNEATLMVDNFIEAELAGKSSHGLSKVMWLVNNLERFQIATEGEDISVVKETPVSLVIDGKKKTAYYVLNEALNRGIAKAQTSGLTAIGLTNTSATTGYMAQYARKATDSELIALIFTGSPSRLVPFGARQRLWGTNPITVGIPTGNLPLILDMATSKITFGDLMNAFTSGKSLAEGVAIDPDGNLTTNPAEAKEGGILPIAEHKGSGLAFVVEVLAGALTSSMMGQTVKGGWGSFVLLIDPEIMRDKHDFYRDVQQGIAELKSLPKAKDNDGDIYFPGEKSSVTRQATIEAGKIEVRDEVVEKLRELS